MFTADELKKCFHEMKYGESALVGCDQTVQTLLAAICYKNTHRGWDFAAEIYNDGAMRVWCISEEIIIENDISLPPDDET